MVIGGMLLSEHDVADWRRLARAKERPAELPYGIEWLEREHGYVLGSPGQSRTRLGRKMRDVVEHRTGLRLQQPVAGLPDAFRSDIVFALMDQYGVVPSWFKEHRLPPYAGRPLVLLACWMAERAATRPELRESLARQARNTDLIVYWSANQTEILRSLGVTEEALCHVGFGVGTDYYSGDVDAERDIDILAVGQDAGRDYGTLLDAVRGTDLRVDLVCRPANLAGLVVPGNVTVHAPVPHAAYRALLRRAKVVAVPTHLLAYPTGQSVALEAASSGAAVAVTSTPAMDEYLDATVAWVPGVGDRDGWRQLLAEALDDPTERLRRAGLAQQRVRQRYSTRMMWAVVAERLQRRGLV